MFLNIFKTTIRSLMKSPLHSIANILGLSVGLATVFLIMLWVNHHISFDDFHSKEDRIFKVMANSRNVNGDVQTSSGGVYEVMEQARENIAAVDQMTFIISNWRWPSEQCFKITEDKPCLYSKGIFADSTFFEIFDFSMVYGADNPLKNPKSIAISASLAKDLYGEENPVGKIYKIDNNFEVEIAGVFQDIPATSSLQFEFVAPIEVVLLLWGQKPENVTRFSFITYLTLKDDNAGTQKVAEINSAINQVEKMKDYPNLEYFLHPLSKEHLHSNFVNGVATGGLSEYIGIFILFAVFILLMSAVNFINLSTARAAIRGREIGVRKVTGATRFSLMLQFMSEALIKVVIATIVALLIVHQVMPLFNIIIGEQLSMIFNAQFLSGIIAIIIFSTLLAGSYPAFIMSGFNPIKALKNKEGLNNGSNGLRRWLTVAQVAISVVIIIVTAVVYLQLDFIQNKNIGYDREGIMMLEPTWNHLKTYDHFRDGLLENHLIQAVGVSNANIVDATFTSSELEWPGKSEEDNVSFKLIGVDQGMLDVFNRYDLVGKGFSQIDSLIEVVLTKSAAEYMSLEDPVGANISLHGETAQIVGIVDDFHTESLHKSSVPVILYKVEPRNSGTVYIRYDKARGAEAIDYITQHYNEYEKFFTMKYSLLDANYQKHYKNELLMGKLSSFVMIISIVIGIVGIVGLSTYNVVRRYKEIGIRKIFGASVSQVIALLSKDFITIAVIANLVAWPVAWFLADNWLKEFAYRIEMPYELFVISFIIITGFIVTMICLQSFKTALMNPADVVKDE